MTPRIVSWSDNEISISPVLSSAASIVSFDSTFSDTYPSHSQMSPTASEPPGLPSHEFGAKQTGLPGISEGKIPRGGHTTPDDSFIRHDAYFFKDGNVTFLVDGTLYCVHRYFFARDSVYFSKRFTQLDIRDHEALSTIISIGDVERKDFEALLSVLYPANFEAHELTYEQWKSMLHLSTRWGFASLRKLTLKSIKPPTSHDQFVLARTYSVDHWVLPALTALCERSLPLSLDEARQMSMEDVILVATVREEIRGGRLRVDTADIPRHVEVAQAGKLNRSMGNDVYLDRPNSEQQSDSTKGPAVNPSVETKDGMAMGVTKASPPGPQQRATKEGDTDESDVKPPSKVPKSPGTKLPHVMDGTLTGAGGWGSATGHSSRSNWGFEIGPVGKSVNASTADLLGNVSNAGLTLGHAHAESGESQLPPLMGETLPAEIQAPQEEAWGHEAPPAETQAPKEDWGHEALPAPKAYRGHEALPAETQAPQEDWGHEVLPVETQAPQEDWGREALPAETQAPQEEAWGHLVARTDVPLVAGAATAGPTVAGDSPEGGKGGGEDFEKAADDEWGIPVKTVTKKKKKKGGRIIYDYSSRPESWY